jgi:hypothetical protein
MAFADAQAGGVIKEFSGKVEITLAGTVSTGDLLGYSSGWKRALGTAGGVIQARLVAGEDGVSGDVITAYALAVIDGRYSGGTPGAVLYVAEGTDNGKATETLPTTQNDATTVVGFMVTTSIAVLRPLSGSDSLDPS